MSRDEFARSDRDELRAWRTRDEAEIEAGVWKPLEECSLAELRAADKLGKIKLGLLDMEDL